MSAAALSVFVFGIYMIVNGMGFAFIPNTMLGLLGVPPTTEPWIRVLGWVMTVLGYYYIMVARNNVRQFFTWTVYARVSVMVVFLLFVLLGWAPLTLLIFGAIDLLGAIWTFLALRSKS